MTGSAGRVFSVVKDNTPVPGCTISELVSRENGYYVFHFSMAEHTSISGEIYHYPKLFLVLWGEMAAVVGDVWTFLKDGDFYAAPTGIPVGTETETGCIYTEINLKKESVMNEAVKAGTVFALKDLLPVQEGKIVNMDIVKEEKLKFVVMSFAAGTALPEHAAPGDALIFALEGEGIIGYEGKEHPIKAGENFRFARGGAHYVKAEQPFKMALFLTLA